MASPDVPLSPKEGWTVLAIDIPAAAEEQANATEDAED